GSDGRTFMLHRAQEQLRHQVAAKQASILNALPAHIALLDAQGLIVSVNAAWARLAPADEGQAPGNGVGFNYLDICDRVEGQGALEARQIASGIRKVLVGAETSFSMEYASHSSTEQRWFLFTATPLTGEQAGGAVVMHLDVTARKRSEQALEELSRKTERRERVLSSALASMTDFAQVYDRDGRLVFVNQPLLDLWGLALDAVVGRNFFDLGYPPELAERLQRQLREVFD